MNNNRLFKGIICASLTALMAVSTCATVYAAKTETTAAAADNDGMPNPFQECANMEEAHEITGFGFSVPPFGNYTISALNYEGIKEIVVRVPNSDNQETVYTNYDKASYEKILDMALKSGDYKAVSTAHLKKLGITAYVNTKNDICYDIMWSRKDGNYGYSIYSSNGNEENSMIWQALKITAYNNVINGYYGDKSLFEAKIEPIPAQVWTGNDLFLKESDVTVTYQGENLESGMDYYVRTFDDTRIGLAKAMIVPTEKSDFVGFNFKTFAVVPQAVTNVRYTDHTSTSVTIRFNTTEGAERYAVFTADSIGAQVADVGAKRGTATQSITIRNLEPDKTYKLIVKPYFEEDGQAWYGPDSEVITTKTDTEALATPAPVYNLTLINATKTSAQISFSKSEEADGYTIFGFKTGKKYADVSTQKGASTLKKTINGLQPGKTYRFTVRPYKKIDGKIYYGDTSKTIVIKTAK